MHLRIVTFNVWNTEGGPNRLRSINRELRRLNPDLIAFQEVVQTEKVKSLDLLLDGLEVQRTHQADLQRFVPPFSDRYGGSAVATRWPHRPVDVLDLRLPDAADVPWATLAVLGGRSVLYHDAWAVAGEGPGYTWTDNNPNAKAGAAEIVRQPGYRARFDYVLVGSWDAHPKAHARVTSAKLAFDQPIDGIWASDHFGLVVDLDVGKGA